MRSLADNGLCSIGPTTEWLAIFFLLLFVESLIIYLMLTKRVKSRIAGEYQKHGKDTGSAEVQAALLTRQIQELADHLKNNPKDQSSRRGLLKIVSKRRRFLGYLKKRDLKSYEKLIKKLELKK